MTPKVAGACSKCDEMVFEVAKRDSERRPVKLGAALESAMRLTFILKNGSRMDLTFCEKCAQNLTPADFPALWKRVMLSWVAESGSSHPCVREHADNAILALDLSRRWLEVR